jgi:hypothetical protein
MRGVRVPTLARLLLGLGIAATLAANVAHGVGNGPIGAAVGAWPALVLVGSYELSPQVARLLQDVALKRRRASAPPPPRVVLVVVAAQKPGPHGSATNATPCAATARS